MKPRRLAELSVLTAVSLIIFIIELQIPNPFPIPGIKLGLANIITVYAVYHFKAYEVAMIVTVRSGCCCLKRSLTKSTSGSRVFSARCCTTRVR